MRSLPQQTTSVVELYNDQITKGKSVRYLSVILAGVCGVSLQLSDSHGPVESSHSGRQILTPVVRSAARRFTVPQSASSLPGEPGSSSGSTLIGCGLSGRESSP